MKTGFCCSSARSLKQCSCGWPTVTLDRKVVMARMNVVEDKLSLRYDFVSLVRCASAPVISRARLDTKYFHMWLYMIIVSKFLGLVLYEFQNFLFWLCMQPRRDKYFRMWLNHTPFRQECFVLGRCCTPGYKDRPRHWLIICSPLM